MSLLAECIGERTPDDLLLDVLPSEHCDVMHALAILYEERVLTSSSNVFGHLHAMSSNPSLWFDDAPSDADVEDAHGVTTIRSPNSGVRVVCGGGRALRPLRGPHIAAPFGRLPRTLGTQFSIAHTVRGA